MKDEKGLYYYPFPQNKRVRMYVKASEDTIYFRLWSADDQSLWQAHGWVPYEAVEQASKMYEGAAFDPQAAYDIRIARALIRENGEQ